MTTDEQIGDLIGDLKKVGQQMTTDNAASTVVTLNQIGAVLCGILDSKSVRDALKELPARHEDQVAQLKVKIQEATAFVAKHNDLLKEQKQLEQHYEKLVQQQALAAVLLKKKETLEQSPLAVITVQNEQTSAQLIQALGVLSAGLAVETDQIRGGLKEALEKARSNAKALETELDRSLQHLSPEPLKTKLAGYRETVHALVAEYNEYAGKINELQANHAELVKLYKAHHTDNGNIRDALTKRHQELGEMESVHSRIKGDLERYDILLKGVVELRDKLPLYELPEIKQPQR